jgi:hypothetical protein
MGSVQSARIREELKEKLKGYPFNSSDKFIQPIKKRGGI